MILIKVTNIQWDTDGQHPKLPKSMKLSLDYDYDAVMADQAKGLVLEDIEEYISDYLSDETCFCHKGFNYKIHRK